MRHCTTRWVGGCLILALAGMFAPLAQADEKVYDSTLPGTVWIMADLGSRQTSFGSGVLVDTKRRWVVTNYHVVEDQTKVRVFFPVREKGEVIAERSHYFNNKSKLAIPGRVVARDNRKDLAVIELASVPKDAKSITLAKRSPRAGQDLHVVGNPAGGALWVYTTGTVRTVYHKRWNVRAGNGRILFLDARVVETDLAINKGDSGGPVVNNKTELVALVSSFQKDQRLVSTCIDVTEIRAILKQAETGVQLVQQGGGISGIGGGVGKGKGKGKADPDVAKALKQTVYKDKFDVLTGGTYRIKLDPKSPVHVYIDSLVHDFKGLKVRRVWADGRYYKQAPPAELLLRLLAVNATRKLGAWEVEKLKDDKYAIVFCHRLHSKATPQEMEAAIRFVFEEADDLDRGRLAGVPIPGVFSLLGTWKATSTGKNWTITFGNKNSMTLKVASANGQPFTLSGTFKIAGGQISLVAGGKTNQLGKLTINKDKTFTIDDGKLRLTFQRVAGGAAPPPVVGGKGNLAGTTWSGKETLQGFGKLSFQFKAGGKAVMTDTSGTTEGAWTQKGNTVTVTFANGQVTYEGTINGQTLSGNATNVAGNRWTFTLKRQ